jgi:uncharacterized protein YecE (DUF72 family)
MARRASGGVRLRVGTSGFGYASWRGAFYPPKTKSDAMLGFYAGVFETVEVNQTFRTRPTPDALAAWCAAVPKDFRFALKAPASITHYRRLRNVDEPLAAFLDVARALGTRRGPLLFQLPPNFRPDHARLDAFLGLLPPRTPAAVEFRHPAWHDEATWAVLRRHRVAACIVDGEDVTPLVATAPFGYVRLRRETYAPRELAAWARRLRDVAGWREAWVYLRHDEAGGAPARARAVRDAAAG